MSANGISHPPKEGKMTITRVKQRVSKKSKCWLEVGDVLLSEEHKSIIESNTQWLDDAIINVYCPECPPGVHLDTRVDSKKSFCRSVMEGT